MSMIIDINSVSLEMNSPLWEISQLEGEHVVQLTPKHVDLPIGVKINGVAPEEIKLSLRPVDHDLRIH